MEILAREATAEATELVKRDIHLVEARAAGGSNQLAESMSRLAQAMRLGQWHISNAAKWADIVTTRNRREHTLACLFLLDFAALILEAEALVPLDRIRLSLIEEDSPGEPMIFLNPSSPGVTRPQKDELVSDYPAAFTKRDKCTNILKRPSEQYYNDLARFWRDDPQKPQLDFDQEHLLYKRQATEMLLEAEAAEFKKHSEVMKADIIKETHDFAWDRKDDKHRFPRTPVQLQAKARKFVFGAERAAPWVESIPDNLYPGIVAKQGQDSNPPPPTDDWDARSVDLQDQDRYSELSLDQLEEMRIKKRLLVRYKGYCRDLRDDFVS